MNPPPLNADDFSAFFRELWAGIDPFPWQREFAHRLCEGQEPDYVAVPTGSGKTACLDAAVFALAVQAALPVAKRTQGRRIFFIVNRRVIVDEAFGRARVLCEKLRLAAPGSMVGRVAAALSSVSGESGAIPLARVQLRGGIYRDRSWVRSLLQPMIICSTVDQVGSRLLFRGYGVSPQARPIHASLVAHDSLLMIDEAHISRPFIQTLEWVEKYRRHQFAGGETVQLPFRFIQLTATPPAETREDQKVMLSPEDQEHPVLKQRLCRAKPSRLIVEHKAKGKSSWEQMAKRLAEEAENVLAQDQPRSIAVMVNRVATARSVAERLKKDYKRQVTLLIGRLRPLDREETTKAIQDRLRTGSAGGISTDAPTIVVSTQCLEVGADLDFDALVTEAASLDALRQRFGRLNRAGREIPARSVIVLPGDQDLPADKLNEAAPCDPIYGNAIPRTWRWLSNLAHEGVVDFGINAMTTAVDALLANSGDEALKGMLSPTDNAPVLLPAYLDCWVQTSPTPAADPDVAIFLHGPQREMSEVQICWRGDLPDAKTENEWADILSMCPPTTAECLPVPLHVFRKWMASHGRFQDLSGDAVGLQELPDRNDKDEELRVEVFVWRGPDERFFADHPADVRTGDTIVLRVQSGGWEQLGHLPDAPADPQVSPGTTLTPKEIRRVDVAERAAASARRRAIVRIHPVLWPTTGHGTAAAALRELSLDTEKDWRIPEIKALLSRLLSEESSDSAITSEQLQVLRHLTGSLVSPEAYPRDQGFVLTSKDLLPDGDFEQTADTDEDALLEAAGPQELFDHSRDVINHVRRSLAYLPLETWSEAIIAAGMAHDWGKIDPRFQAMLRGTTPFAAMASATFLAKSGSIASSAASRRAARERAEIPDGFRHEMLSVLMAESSGAAAVLPSPTMLKTLVLHLIATHHGYGRPFAPWVDDGTPPDVNLSVNDLTIAVNGDHRVAHPAHALDSGLTERFWKMNRHYGWWGIALLETVLRLADQTASSNPQAISRS